MTFTLAAYRRNITSSGVYVELQAVFDAVLPTNPATGRFYSSRDGIAVGAYAGGNSLDRARFGSQWRSPTQVRPTNFGAVALPSGTRRPPLAEWLPLPVRVAAMEDIMFEAMTFSIPNDYVGLVWFSDEGLTPAPNGELLTLRGDSVAAASSYAWTEIAVTWESILPPGRYGIVGSECVSATGIAHRWIVDTSNNRPGAISAPDLYCQMHPYQQNAELGLWAEFSAPAMPRLEVLCSGADASHTSFIQLVRL